MDQDLHEKIRAELATYLNREPSEDEIRNGQTDHVIMGRIRDKEIDILKQDVKKKSNG